MTDKPLHIENCVFKAEIAAEHLADLMKAVILNTETLHTLASRISVPPMTAVRLTENDVEILGSKYDR